MADQPDIQLEREYATTTARVRRFILSEFDLQVLGKLAPGYPPYPNRWREVWQVPVLISSREMRLLIAIPKTFPDHLPIVFLPQDVKEQGRTIPHLNREREFCTFDRTEVRINSDNPEGIVLAVIERARKLLEEGILGSNQRDYLDEFEAYWEQGTADEALSLVTPVESVKNIVCLRLNRPWKDWGFLFADDETTGRHWLSSVGYKQNTKSAPALYLPLKDLGLPPYPSTNGELYDRLKEHDADALHSLLGFLGKRPRPTGILFSVPTDGTRRAMGAWWHPNYSHQVHRRRKHKRSANISIEFKPDEHPVEVELSVKHRKEKLLRASVERVDQERLSVRTAGFMRDAYEQPLNVVGCGSIGSLVAARLAEAGMVSKFRLIDPERLAVENVPRHYCGMADIGEFKSNATANKISRHFPHIECETKQVDILDLLRTSPVCLVPTSLMLVCVGNLSTERRLNRLTMSAVGPGTPHCYVWVEPHLYGGHALFVTKGNGSCFECAFDKDLLFKHRVIKDTGQFSMREAGCRSTYVPYSSLYANEFVSAVVRFLINTVDRSENQILTWTGDLQAARHQGIAVVPEWESALSFSSFVRKLTPDPSCPVCAQ